MKRIEVIEYNKMSVFKTTIYLMCIPMALIAFIGLIVCVAAFVSGKSELLIFGLPYTIMPFIMIFFYAGISALVSLIYNVFAKKFGGMELTVVEKE